MNHSLYQDEILKALPFKRLPWGRRSPTSYFIEVCVCVSRISFGAYSAQKGYGRTSMGIFAPYSSSMTAV